MRPPPRVRAWGYTRICGLAAIRRPRMRRGDLNMMKLWLAAALVAGAVGAAPAMAADAGPARLAPVLLPNVQGYVGIGAAWFNDGPFGSDESLAVVAMGGNVNIPLAQALNLQ